MCRGKGDGGRRCPGCVGRTGLNKHNDRRRKNRAIRHNLIDWAQQQGMGNTAAADLARASPKVVKDWAEAQGVDPERFVAGIPSDPFARGQGAVGGAGAGAAPAGGNAAAASPAAPVAAPGLPGGAGGRGRRGRGAGSGAGGVGAAAGPVALFPSPPGHPGPAAGAHGRPVPAWSQAGWCTGGLQSQIQAAQAQQGVDRDERSLLNGTPVKIKTLSRRASGSSNSPRGGTNTTRRIELDNGAVGYFKPFDGVDDNLASGFGQDSSQQSLHEAAAWRLASQMGPPWSEIVPPVVIREVNGEIGSFALERPGKNMTYSPWHSAEWREAAFFDSLIGQQDRHPGNYLVAGDRLALIDHGYTFARPGDYKNYSWFVNHRAQTDPALSYQERQTLERLVASPDLMGLQSLVQPDRAQALRARAEDMLRSGTLREQY